MSKFGFVPIPKLTVKQKILMLANGYVFYKYMKTPGDAGYSEVYIVRCLKHGYYLDYPQGHGQWFYCPHCEKENKLRCLA
jgi:hypothetical protein